MITNLITLTALLITYGSLRQSRINSQITQTSIKRDSFYRVLSLPRVKIIESIDEGDEKMVRLMLFNQMSTPYFINYVQAFKVYPKTPMKWFPFIKRAEKLEKIRTHWNPNNVNIAKSLNLSQSAENLLVHNVMNIFVTIPRDVNYGDLRFLVDTTAGQSFDETSFPIGNLKHASYVETTVY